MTLISLDALLLLVAGIAAGVVGTAGGITSLISYPALLAVGLSARGADIANVVAVAACWPGALVVSGAELAGRGGWLGRWVPVAAAAGAGGSLLLIATPNGAFTSIIPFLVLISGATLLAEPVIRRRRANRGPAHPGALPAGLVATSLYGGYFGAGSGIMILTLLLVCVDAHLPRANALKNMLVGGAAVAGGLTLAISAGVRWSAVVPLAVGEFAGALLGPRVARGLPTHLLRGLIVLVAIGLAIELWIGA
jgi:uncharacterized membrane protein YfcA